MEEIRQIKADVLSPKPINLTFKELYRELFDYNLPASTIINIWCTSPIVHQWVLTNERGELEGAANMTDEEAESIKGCSSKWYWERR